MDLVRVIAVNTTILFVMSMGQDGRLEATGGADAVLLKLLSSYVPFRYELMEQPDHLWGTVNKDGEWTGMIGSLQRGEADMALGWIANTYDRDEAVDFSFPYLVDATIFFTPSPHLGSKNFAFLDPFQYTVWISLLLSLPISAFVLVLLGQKSGCRQVLNAAKFSRRVLKELGGLLILYLGQGSYRTYWFFPVRVFMMVWTASKLVLIFAYCSVLLSILMVPTMEKPIDTVQQLRDAIVHGKYHIAVYRGVSHFEYLMNADSGLLKDLADDLRRHPENVLRNADSGVSRLRRGELLATLAMRMHFGLVSSGMGSHLFHISADTFGYNPVSVALRRGFPDRERINIIIHRINQSGVYKRHLDILRHKFSLKAPRPPPKGEVRALSFQDMQRPLQILGASYAVASSCLLLELLCHRMKSPPRRKSPPAHSKHAYFCRKIGESAGHNT